MPCKNGRTDRAAVWMVSGVGPRNRDGRAHWRHLTNTVERLCEAAMRVDLLPGVATRPVPKLLWAVFFSLLREVPTLLVVVAGRSWNWRKSWRRLATIWSLLRLPNRRSHLDYLETGREVLGSWGQLPRDDGWNPSVVWWSLWGQSTWNSLNTSTSISTSKHLQ